MATELFVDYETAKSKVIRDLELLVNDELLKKVNNLNEIVDHIEQNWQGSNAQRSKEEINNIINSIGDFKRNVLDKNLQNITAQVEQYQKFEDVG